MKEDLAGGKLPSSEFGANAAWWWIMILAFNLNSAMKQLVLQGSWVGQRMKAIRFSLIGLPGRVMKHARGLIVRLVKNHPSLVVLVKARERIMGWAIPRPGRNRGPAQNPRKTRLGKKREGGLYPKLPWRRDSDKTWMTKLAEGLL